MTGLDVKGCKSCSAAIYFVPTLASIEAGEKIKLLPVDVDPVPDGNVELIERNGRMVAKVRRRGPKVGESLFDEELYVSHFVTCPNAGQWRK